MATAHDRGFRYDALLARVMMANPAETANARAEVGFVVDSLGLPKGASVLDLPCGTGRHAALLGRRGYRVTAVDVSHDCLETARAENRHRNVRYERLDAKHVATLGQTFDAVVGLYSFIGSLATDAENISVLGHMFGALRRGGRFLLSTACGEFVRRLGETRYVFEAAGHAVVRTDRWEPGSNRLYQHMWILDHARNRWRSYEQRRLIYTRTEMERRLRRCGAHRIRCFSSFDGAPFRGAQSAHVIYVGEKR